MRAVGLLSLLGMVGCSVKTNVDATGTPPAMATHLAVTVTGVWLSSAADTLPEASNGWLKQTLATPVVVDLATLTPGTLASLATQVGTTAGTYKQVHLQLAESADTLTAPAQSLGLLYNAQYSYANASGSIVDNPLEMPAPGYGITIPVNLTLTGKISLNGSAATSSGTSSATTGSISATTSGISESGTTTTVSAVVAIDAERDLLSFAVGNDTGYILSATTSLVDESLAGAITGTVDTSALPSGHAPVWVSAEIPDPTGTHRVIAARALLDGSGAFTLYPLPATKSGAVDYDVVVSCAGADTVIITGVPVTAQPVTSPVILSSSALALVAAPTAYADVSPDNVLLPGGARVVFYQTAAAIDALPFAIDGTAVDPVSHRLAGDAFALASGPLLVGAYASGGSVTLNAAPAAQGNGSFIVGSEGLYRTDTLATAATSVAGTQAAPTLVSVPAPTVATGGRLGTLTVSVSAAAGAFDSGFLVVSAGGRVVETANIRPLVAAGSGTLTLSLPAGSALSAGAGVPYQLAARAWSSANPTGTYVVVPAASSVSLGDTGAASVALSIP